MPLEYIYTLTLPGSRYKAEIILLDWIVLEARIRTVFRSAVLGFFQLDDEKEPSQLAELKCSSAKTFLESLFRDKFQDLRFRDLEGFLRSFVERHGYDKAEIDKGLAETALPLILQWARERLETFSNHGRTVQADKSDELWEQLLPYTHGSRYNSKRRLSFDPWPLVKLVK